MEIIYFLIGALLVSVGMSLYSKSAVPTWKERQFGEYPFQWNKILITSSVVSFAVSSLVFAITGSPWVAIAIAPLGYMLILGSVTDFKIAKIPLGVSVLAYLIPIPLMVMFADNYGWFSFGVWMALTLLFAVFWFFGAFGLADLRIMLLAGTSLSWWVGAENILLAFGFSAAIQLMIHPFAAKFNLGVVKQRKTQAETLKDSETARKIANGEEVDAIEPTKERKAKRFVPFGPALYTSFTLLAIVYGFYMLVDLRNRFA